MSIPINIQNNVIQFPSVAQSPDWGQAIIQFAQAVQGALASVAGPFDVPQQVLDISASNPATNVIIAPLNFPSTEVRSAFILYAVARTAQNPVSSANESGTIIVLYDSTAGTWSLERDYIGDGAISFSIDNNGQVSYSTTQIGTINHVGALTIQAKSILQTS